MSEKIISASKNPLTDAARTILRLVRHAPDKCGIRYQ
jgi:hypothetical protein